MIFHSININTYIFFKSLKKEWRSVFEVKSPYKSFLKVYTTCWVKDNILIVKIIERIIKGDKKEKKIGRIFYQ